MAEVGPSISLTVWHSCLFNSPSTLDSITTFDKKYKLQIIKRFPRAMWMWNEEWSLGPLAFQSDMGHTASQIHEVTPLFLVTITAHLLNTCYMSGTC